MLAFFDCKTHIASTSHTHSLPPLYVACRFVVGRNGSQLERIQKEKGRSSRLFVECHRGVHSRRSKTSREGDRANRNATDPRALSATNPWSLRAASRCRQGPNTAGTQNTAGKLLHVRRLHGPEHRRPHETKIIVEIFYNASSQAVFTY